MFTKGKYVKNKTIIGLKLNFRPWISDVGIVKNKTIIGLKYISA